MRLTFNGIPLVFDSREAKLVKAARNNGCPCDDCTRQRERGSSNFCGGAGGTCTACKRNVAEGKIGGQMKELKVYDQKVKEAAAACPQAKGASTSTGPSSATTTATPASSRIGSRPGC